MTLTSLRAALVALVLGSSAACGSSGGSPTAPSTTASAAAAAPTLNLAGTWSGTLRDPGNSDPIQVRSWTASQNGASVSGPLIVVVDADEDGTATVNTTLAGTVSGSQVVSAIFSVAAGAIPDPALATCAFSGTGTLSATASAITGTLAMTFPPACVGEEKVSETPTATWMLSLSK